MYRWNINLSCHQKLLLWWEPLYNKSLYKEMWVSDEVAFGLKDYPCWVCINMFTSRETVAWKRIISLVCINVAQCWDTRVMQRCFAKESQPSQEQTAWRSTDTQVIELCTLRLEWLDERWMRGWGGFTDCRPDTTTTRSEIIHPNLYPVIHPSIIRR